MPILDLTRDDLDLIRNALGAWADRRRWHYGDDQFCKSLDRLALKIWEQNREQTLRADAE